VVDLSSTVARSGKGAYGVGDESSDQVGRRADLGDEVNGFAGPHRDDVEVAASSGAAVRLLGGGIVAQLV